MSDQSLLNEVRAKAQAWTQPPHDEDTRQTVQAWLDTCDTDDVAREALIDAFYTDLSFGTGGLRGKMGPGTNRINATTIANATQGLANHLKKVHGAHPRKDGCIALPSHATAAIEAKNLPKSRPKCWRQMALKLGCILNSDPRPQLSWTVRELGAVGGVVVTASHNPSEYNGYKVYGADGAQVVAPEDAQLVAEVRALGSDEDVREAPRGFACWTTLGTNDSAPCWLRSDCLRISWNTDQTCPLCTLALHGTGALAVPPALEAFGFRNVMEVASQAIPDGAFPTVASPNPEEAPALAEAVALAREQNASLVMGTDPDSDRVGLAVPDGNGDFVLLNGNETAALLTDHVLSKWQESGKLDQPSFVAKTVVTTNLLVDLAQHYGVEVRETLTGFKYIAEAIRKEEGQCQYVVGGEESYGYLVGDQVRDKDAVQSCCLLAELAHELDQRGERMLDRLEQLHRRHGAYKEGLVSLVKDGREGKAQIDAMMRGFRETPPTRLAGEEVVEIIDFQTGEVRSPQGVVLGSVSQASSNVMQFVTSQGSRITARPSGTEPKIKFYVSVREDWDGQEAHADVMARLQARVEAHFLALGVSGR